MSDDITRNQAAPDTEREALDPAIGQAIWGAIAVIIVIGVLAFPMRVQFWEYGRELREWIAIREVWSLQIQHAPVFGTQSVTRVLLAVSIAVVVAATLWILRLILVQPDDDAGGI